MFGAASKTPFGTGSTFGTGTTAFGAQSTASPFGTTTAATGGLFANKAQTGGFGTGFGTTQTAGQGLFGSSNAGTGTSLFGGTTTGSLFGQPATTTASALGGFGSPAGSLFGSTATTSAGTGLFGQTAGSTFGSTAGTGFGTTGSLFSAPSTSTTPGGLFGATSTGTTGSMFGGTTSTGFGAFGANTTAAAQGGTPVKFSVVNGTDQMVKQGLQSTVNTRHQCITVMKEYEGKSFEELRFEDYTLGRKGGATGATVATGSMFAATPATSATTGGLFGSTTTTGFGGATAFGQNKTAFGTGTTAFGTGTTAFGQPATGGLFGASKPGGLFGTNTATTATSGFGGFGTTPASGGLFGQTTTGQTGGLFGGTTTTQAGSLFGGGTTAFGQTAATPATGLFGQTGFGTATQPSTLFNKGLGTTTGFGAGTTGGLFGATAVKPATGLTFGTPGLGTSAFGASTGTQGSLFGNTGFGTTTTGFGTNTGTSLFGGSTGLGVGTTGLTTGLGGTAFGSTLGQTAGLNNLAGNNLLSNQNANLLAVQQQQLALQQQIMALNNSPFGDSKLFRNSLLEKAKTDKVASTTTVSTQKLGGSPSHYKVSARLTAKMKPRPLNNHTMNKSQLFEGLEEDSGLSPDTFVPRKSIKKLVINRNRGTPDQASSSSDILRLRNGGDEEDELVAPVSPYPSSPHSSRLPQTPPPSRLTDLNDSRDSERDNTTPIGVRFSRSGRQPLNDTLEDLNVRSRGGPVENEIQRDDEDGEQVMEPCGIILTRPEYYTEPPIEKLNNMVDNDGEVWVDDFVVGREGYGTVKFLGRTNVADLNLDKIVSFRRREIEVYPDTYPNKPPVGEELNKKSEITLIKVWPNDKTSHKPIKTPERLRQQGWFDKVEAATAKLGATFMDYQPQTGTWTFMVEHFTRYGLHEFLEDESVAKKLKKPSGNTDVKEKEDVSVEKDKLEMLRMLRKLREAQEKQEAYDQENAMAAEKAAAALSASESMHDQESDDMDDIDQQTFPDEMYEDDDVVESPASHHIAAALGMNAHRMQVQKASFFGESEHSMPSPKPKGSLQTDKSLLSGSFDEGRPRASYPGGLGHGALLTQRVTRAPDDGASTRRLAPALFGSPRIGTMPSKYPLAHDSTGVTASSPMMHPSAIGSAYDRGTKLVGARAHQKNLVPKDESLVDCKENLIADMGLVMGRSFRVGWGPGFTLVHGGKPLGTQHKKTASVMQSSMTGDALFSRSRLLMESTEGSSPFGVVVERMNIAPHLKHDSSSAVNQHQSALEVELEHCTSSKTSDGCPFFEPSSGTKALHHHATIARKNKEAAGSGPLHDVATQHSLVWDLAVALWGKLGQEKDEDDEEASRDDRDSYENHTSRREALSNWLADAAKERVKKEVDTANFEEGDYLQAIWSHLSGKQISAACQLAQRNDDYRLSLLLSQVSGTSTVRNLIQKQLSDWEQIKADKYITDERIKIYCLIAGIMVWRTSSPGFLNACEDLDWKRVLAVHMWYHNSPTSSISDVLSTYEDAFKGRTNYGKYGAAPCPPYREGEDQEEEEEEDEEEGNTLAIRDTCYHLLKLYCKRSHRLERTLAPATYTSYQLDFRLSWHLYQALQSLGYSHLSQYHAGVLHSGFASQLEALGMWEWAAFVLLHLTDKEKREHSVRSLIFRHCQLCTTDEYVKKESFLKEQLHIPAGWIHEAKAMRAKYNDMAHDEALHLLRSGHWNLSHEVMLSKLASDAVINEDFATLKALLGEMSPRERCCTIKGWNTGGQVLLDFLNVGEKFQELTQGSREPTKYDFEEIHMQVASLCNRINNLPCATAKDRLCQYELAKQCANYLKLATSELGDRCLDEDIPLPTHVTVPYISKLPLPEDCALAELADLTESYVRELTIMQ